MSSYMHMGHNTENLVGERDLEEFTGIILSPVNRSPGELSAYVNRFRRIGEYDIVFDPQLYFPRARIQPLGAYPYFPSDLETADIASMEWWDDIIKLIAQYAEELGVDTVCSPVMYPNIWSDDYFTHCVDISGLLSGKLIESDIRVLTTILIDIGYLSDEDSIMRTASILSKRDCAGYYIVFESDIEPRREFYEPNEIFGMIKLINELTNTSKPILVAHCSSDMVLFKAAGASHCATGKFFNLRRFTKSRYREPAAGGGQLSYWFEQSLMAFLREAELLRIMDEGHEELIGFQFSGNYWSNEIIENLTGTSPSAWVGLGWRQYLSWFGKSEEAIKSGDIQLVNGWLRNAEDGWRKLEDDGILMDDPRNDGAWLRPWRIALNKFVKQIES
jgi:hypothetical protein